MDSFINGGTESEVELKIAREQASGYAMALDSMARIAHSESEKEAIESVLKLFEMLFFPEVLYYVSLINGEPRQIYSLYALTENETAIKGRIGIFKGIYSWMASQKGFQVKIKFQGTDFGILEVDNVKFPENKEHYLNLTLSITGVCGLAIENARRHQVIKDAENNLLLEKTKLEQAFESEQRSRHEIEFLLRALEAFTSILDANEIVDYLYRYVDSSILSHKITIYLLKEEGFQVINRTEGTSGNLIERTVAPTSEKFFQLKELPGPVVIDDVQYAEIEHAFPFCSDTCSAMIIPLSFQHCVVGYLTAENRKEEGEFEDAEVRMVKALANEASISLENARLFQEVEKLSTTDPLTGLHNRRYFNEEARKLLMLSVRHKRSLSVIISDIDFFKKVNDTYGHVIGDEVLKKVAQTCQGLIRETDLSARFGGEEFCFLLPETNSNEAFIIAEKVRTSIAKLQMNANGHIFSITASFGISECAYANDSLESLIKRSDEALYEAKRKGRNCSVIWSP